MSKEILINVTPQETRVAILENGVLQELYIERISSKGLVGNIYLGKVVRVLPGMDAAFVDVGLERAAFLHASDIENQQLQSTGEELSSRKISQLLHEGKKVLVQVVKDPLGTKGARLTTNITIPSRYLVFLPDSETIGVSSKIEDEEIRQHLKNMLLEHDDLITGAGYILRTAAERSTPESLRRDIKFLNSLWKSIAEQKLSAKAGSVIHQDLPLHLRVLRDMVDEDLEKIKIDSRENCKRMNEFASRYVTELTATIEHYPGERPIFDLYGVEDEIQKALERKVQLKSGGYLIIDQTEAMTAIDVNTGAFVGHRNLEETIFKTNLEAAQAIVRQLRLRNLGGIIIIDFIDMQEEEHKRQVMRALNKCLDKDHAKTNVCEVSSLGLVEMTRKRTRESLEHILCEGCPTCGGRGSVKTSETICYEIFREIIREARQFDAQKLMVLAAQEVVDRLLDEESSSLAELEAFVEIPIRLQAEALYSQEQFDIVIM
ncbi:MAG: ribonuclease G [Gammaproteobacteria bacterium]|nr:ribonuclease G [Gammaproteobacteria bacterium]